MKSCDEVIPWTLFLSASDLGLQRDEGIWGSVLGIYLAEDSPIPLWGSWCPGPAPSGRACSRSQTGKAGADGVPIWSLDIRESRLRREHSVE